jgi:hypothetical protein
MSNLSVQPDIPKPPTAEDLATRPAEPAAKPKKSIIKRVVLLVLGAMALGAALAIAYWPRPVVDVELRDKRIAQAQGAAPVDPMTVQDALYTKQVVGTWFQKKHGTRTLIIMPGGKARMIMEPSPLYALAFGKRIDATMYWSVKDGYIDYGVNGGTPADKIEQAKDLIGDFWHEKIVSIDEKTIVVVEADNDVSTWTRIADYKSPAEEKK